VVENNMKDWITGNSKTGLKGITQIWYLWNMSVTIPNVTSAKVFVSSCMFLRTFSLPQVVFLMSKTIGSSPKMMTKTEAQNVCFTIDTASRLPTICIVTDHVKKK